VPEKEKNEKRKNELSFTSSSEEVNNASKKMINIHFGDYDKAYCNVEDIATKTKKQSLMSGYDSYNT